MPGPGAIRYLSISAPQGRFEGNDFPTESNRLTLMTRNQADFGNFEDCGWKTGSRADANVAPLG